MQPLTTSRSVQIDAGTHRVWDALATGEGLTRWLAEDIEVEVVPGGVGRLVDDRGIAHRLVVTEVEDGTRLGFTWWSDDQPDQASTVVITVEGDAENAQVVVTETLDPQARVAHGAMGARVDSVLDATVAHLAGIDGWAGRLGRLALVATTGRLVASGA